MDESRTATPWPMVGVVAGVVSLVAAAPLVLGWLEARAARERRRQLLQAVNLLLKVPTAVLAMYQLVHLVVR